VVDGPRSDRTKLHHGSTKTRAWSATIGDGRRSIGPGIHDRTRPGTTAGILVGRLVAFYSAVLGLRAVDGDDMQLVMTTHVDLGSAPALMEEAGVPVVAALRVALMLPRGHGRLSLRSPDPAVQPKIELNYCSDPEDERRHLTGTAVLAEASALARMAVRAAWVPGASSGPAVASAMPLELTHRHRGSGLTGRGVARIQQDRGRTCSTDRQ
jgi:hypothetical protein